MNSTERYKHVIGVYTSPSAPHDHLTHKNEYWRVVRDLAIGPSGGYYSNPFRRSPYPKPRATMWSRRDICKGYAHDPIKPVVRYLRLQRMLDRYSSDSLRKFFRICHARALAYGNRIYLQRARAESRTEPVLTVRQKRITTLVRANEYRLQRRAQRMVA